VLWNPKITAGCTRNFTCLYYVLFPIYVKVSRRDVHKKVLTDYECCVTRTCGNRTSGRDVIKIIAVIYAFVEIFAYIAPLHLRVRGNRSRRVCTFLMGNNKIGLCEYRPSIRHFERQQLLGDVCALQRAVHYWQTNWCS